MKTTRVAINGFGRIGRAFLKVAFEQNAKNPEHQLEIVGVNDLGDVNNFAYLLKYDTAYGKSAFDIKVDASDPAAPAFIIDGKRVNYVSQKDPAMLPWKAWNIDIVVESTGLYVTADKAQAHILAGAKRVVVTAPLKDEANSVNKANTVLMGINEADLGGTAVTSNASCTTNAGSPLIYILNEKLGIEKAVLNTVHAYTASQALVDGPAKKDWREGRAAAQNIVPSTTGAAIAVTKVIPQLAGLFDGISVRVPVITGSIVDVTFISKRPTTVEEVNAMLKAAAAEPRWQGIFKVSEEELVSHDIVGEPYGSIADLKFTKVVGGNLVKVMAWYDNEMGYTHTLVRHVTQVGALV